MHNSFSLDDYTGVHKVRIKEGGIGVKCNSGSTSNRYYRFIPQADKLLSESEIYSVQKEAGSREMRF